MKKVKFFQAQKSNSEKVAGDLEKELNEKFGTDPNSLIFSRKNLSEMTVVVEFMNETFSDLKDLDPLSLYYHIIIYQKLQQITLKYQPSLVYKHDAGKGFVTADKSLQPLIIPALCHIDSVYLSNPEQMLKPCQISAEDLLLCKLSATPFNPAYIMFKKND